jgi:uncharacterized protein YkwD
MITRRMLTGVGMAVLLATAGVGWHATTGSPGPQPVQTASSSPLRAWFPRFPTTTAPKATTTTVRPPTTTTTTAPATTTTAKPATTTTVRPRVTTTTTTQAPAPAPTQPTVAGQLLAAVNARRATGTTCGGTWYPAVPALRLQSQLSSAAQGHAADMAARNYFSHTGLDGSTPETRIAATGYRSNGWAENIAAGQTSVDEVMNGWWSSTGHCVDFMAGFVTQVGFGLAQNPSTTYRTYWVADMAAPG